MTNKDKGKVDSRDNERQKSVKKHGKHRYPKGGTNFFTSQNEFDMEKVYPDPWEGSNDELQFEMDP